MQRLLVVPWSIAATSERGPTVICGDGTSGRGRRIEEADPQDWLLRPRRRSLRGDQTARPDVLVEPEGIRRIPRLLQASQALVLGGAVGGDYSIVSRAHEVHVGPAGAHRLERGVDV